MPKLTFFGKIVFSSLGVAVVGSILFFHFSRNISFSDKSVDKVQTNIHAQKNTNSVKSVLPQQIAVLTSVEDTLFTISKKQSMKEKVSQLLRNNQITGAFQSKFNLEKGWNNIQKNGVIKTWSTFKILSVHTDTKNFIPISTIQMSRRIYFKLKNGKVVGSKQIVDWLEYDENSFWKIQSLQLVYAKNI